MDKHLPLHDMFSPISIRRVIAGGVVRFFLKCHWFSNADPVFCSYFQHGVSFRVKIITHHVAVIKSEHTVILVVLCPNVHVDSILYLVLET